MCPARDNALVARLRAAGAIVAGKTNVPEMGAGANSRNTVWGATGNPFNPLLNAGGSSGGSAAALATDLLPLCSGSDTGGSLRIPAAKCGVVGFRPSPGLVPSERKLLGWTPISVVGPWAAMWPIPCCNCAPPSDCIRAIRWATRSRGEFAALPQIDLAQLRIGYTEDFGVCEVDDGIRQVFRDKMAAIGRFVKVCEPVQVDMGEAHRAFDVIRPKPSWPVSRRPIGATRPRWAPTPAPTTRWARP
jgi:Asp-tRNA(Asn)/Glu-tRNA(Gln) amidotransferase A subunit family amidase